MTFKKIIEEHFLLKLPVLLFTNIIFVLIRWIFRQKGDLSKNVILISLHKLGDTVFTIPAILEVIKKYPSNITIVCFDHSKKIYQQIFNDLNYIVLNREDFIFSGRFAKSKARTKLKNLYPNIIIDLVGSVVSASLIFNARCEKIYGVNEIYFKAIYNKFSLIRTTPHQIDIYLDAIKTFIPDVVNHFSGYSIEYNENETILIQPFAGWKSKEWGLVKFLKLYHRLSSNNKCAFIFPKESINPEVVLQLQAENVKIISSDNIESLLEAIAGCSLFISNDSGPLQIAALLGKPTFTIYGPTNPDFHLPYGNFHRHKRKILSCSPLNEKYCFADGGDSCPHNDCLELLGVDEVYDNVNQLIHELKYSFSIPGENEK